MTDIEITPAECLMVLSREGGEYVVEIRDLQIFFRTSCGRFQESLLAAVEAAAPGLPIRLVLQRGRWNL